MSRIRMKCKYLIGRVSLVMLLLLTSVVITACGQKGDLYIPADKSSSNKSP
ncbi:MAG TPA: lipoprotein [Gammaproteobacteria bacterium]